MIDKKMNDFSLTKLELEFINMLTEKKFLAVSYQEIDFYDDYIYFAHRIFEWLLGKFYEEK